jgi:hypothetical protein
MVFNKVDNILILYDYYWFSVVLKWDSLTNQDDIAGYTACSWTIV